MEGKKKIFHKKKIWLALGLVAGIVMVSGGIYFIQGKSVGKASAEEIPVQETQAKKGTISNSIVGTGNLKHEEGESVTIPTGIIVEEVKVESGDQVSEGDVLAIVNQTSVLRAMEEIQEQMEDLDEEINESKETSDTQSIKAKMDGRVKKIYVQQGQEAAECMVEQGALLLLSIDGFLAVEFETNAEIAKDDSVIIDRADGTQKEGTVEDVSNGKCTVLFSDSGIGMEEEVTISDSEGNVLGNGITYIHQPLAVTAASGTVEEICVSEDEAVYTGTVLFTVDQGGESLEYQEQMAERQELAQNLQKLMILSQNGAIIAESSGTIQSVNISTESSQGTQGNTGTVQISKQSSQSSVGALQVSRKDSQSTQGSAEAIQLSVQNIQGNTGMVQLSKQESDADINPQMPSEEQRNYLSLEITDSGKTNQNLLVIEPPKTGAKPQTELKAVDGSYEGIISWNPEDKKFAAKTSYQAEVELNAAEGYCFTKESINQIKTGVLSGIVVSEDGKTLTFQITYPVTEVEENDDNPNNNGNENQNGNGNNDGNESNNESGNQNDNGNNDGNGNQNGNGNNNGNQNNNGNNDGNSNNDGNGNQNNNGNQNGNGNNDDNGNDNGNQNNNGNQNGNGNNDDNGNDNGNQNNNGNQNGNENENENNSSNQENNGTQEGAENNNKNGSQESNISGTENGGGDHTQNNNAISQAENGVSNGQTQTASNNTSSSGSGTLTSSTSGSSNAQSSSTETSSNTDDSEITAFTLATADTMILSVNVDELDINSVSKEQQAEIVLDAIEDETFTGTVTKVGSSASSSSGGVAKYTVEISVPRDERMKEGMNASATITVEERENVVTIPVNALQERGSRVFVYTETDSDGSLLGEKEVTTGLSDGANVEITEGLSEGDIVYYHKIGNTSQKNGEQSFHKIEGGPAGDMGNMRQGGFPSGDSGSGMPSGGMPGGRE